MSFITEGFSAITSSFCDEVSVVARRIMGSSLARRRC